MFHEKQFGLFAAGSFLNEPARFSFSSCHEREVLFNQSVCGIKMFHEKHFFQVSGRSLRCKTAVTCPLN